MMYSHELPVLLNWDGHVSRIFCYLREFCLSVTKFYSRQRKWARLHIQWSLTFNLIKSTWVKEVKFLHEWLPVNGISFFLVKINECVAKFTHSSISSIYYFFNIIYFSFALRKKFIDFTTIGTKIESITCHIY